MTGDEARIAINIARRQEEQECGLLLWIYAVADHLSIWYDESKEVDDCMRRFQKQQILDVIAGMHTLHGEVRGMLDHNDYQSVQAALADCQAAAIQIGEAIEQIEGSGTDVVSCLEHYCENVYQVNVQIETIQPQKAYKSLEEILIKAENAVKHIHEKIEVVFLPYKVSMWDSLESVWKTADSDPDCDAYVIPIPYYDKNSDKSLGAEHYEGDEYPEDVPVTHYGDYDFESRRPDMIFFHNPYDQFNNMTSVHPFFYSKNLKSFTDMLVYIPYYATSGGMSDDRGYMLSYYYADYIIIQSERYRKFFDPNLSGEKLLPFGSPKFDKIIRLCNNPPEPPAEWKEKMAGKKVFFYNIGINGLLINTKMFLEKIEYVFRCFSACKNACLVWRPHPLLEAAFTSMRAEYKPIYEKLKQYFLENDIGIYDDTPEIEPTIALCDAYIGNAGSSVTSLFGMAGKPVFILNNGINSVPEENDWRGEIIQDISAYNDCHWMITQGNKLYYSVGDNYQYRFYCDLSNYAYGCYYLCVLRVRGKDYVCPMSAQEILVIGDGGIEKRVTLKRCTEQQWAFYGAAACDNYLFLIPDNYPAVVRYDTVSGEVIYLEEHLDMIAENAQGKRGQGGYCVQNGYLFIASAKNSCVLVIHAKTGKTQVVTINASHGCGCKALFSDGTDLWFLPCCGTVITRWNPESGEVCEYADLPAGFECKNPVLGYVCQNNAFSSAAFCGDYVYLSPLWANMFIRIDRRNGEMTEWKPPFEQPDSWENGYYLPKGRGTFCGMVENTDGKVYRFYSDYDRKYYDVDLDTQEYKEIKVEFDRDELSEHEPGFQEYSEWLQYACQENALNSLSGFLNGKVAGNQFDREKAISAYSRVAENSDGTSGEKIFGFLRDRLYVQ